MGHTCDTFQTRIGTIIQAQRIESLSGARDVGGGIITRTGRVVIAAAPSDGELDHPYTIVVTDDGGKTIREVFSMPAGPRITYSTIGLTYDQKHHVIISMFGRNDGYQYNEQPFGRALPFSMDRCGDNDAIVALSCDNGETWSIDKVVRLEKPQNSHGMSGHGVQVGDDIFFPHPAGTSNPERTLRRVQVYLARLHIMPKTDGAFTCDYEHRFRTLATNEDRDVPFASETLYLAKVDGAGYLSFTRSYTPDCRGGPPYRREYDLDHRPICEFERSRTVGFDQRDYDLGHNGPMLVAFGITRMADGNLLYASRFYGTDHHRAGNIFMTSKDDGKTWLFVDDYLPSTIAPLEFPNSGAGGNPQMHYGSDGTLMHITSEGCMYDDPPRGGYHLCRFKGISIEGQRPTRSDGRGTISIDVSTISRIEDVYIAKISIAGSTGVELSDENVNLYAYSGDATKVSFDYKITGSPAFVCPKIVLANRSNPYRPVFGPRIDLT